ncbi:MAG: ABC transporter permease, partial [Clostridiales bacterium]|nr:ABC transporter permease [Clostridiales bacterium]
MRWSDILRAAFENLMRRKLRSTLTMLGVLIGTAAIVVTISLGHGAEYTQTRALSEATNLMLITVQPRYDTGGGELGSRRVTKITDSVLADLRRIDGVEAATPLVMVWGNASFVLRTGRYETYAMMTAVDPAAFAKIQKLKTGRYFTGNTDRMEFIMSEMSMIGFVDTKKKDPYAGYVDVYTLLTEGKPLPLPDIKWLSARYEMAIQWQEYDESNADGEPTERSLTFAGRMMGTMEASLYDWTFSGGPVVNLNWLKRFYKTNRDAIKELNFVDLSSYDTVLVLAQSVDQVKDIT